MPPWVRPAARSDRRHPVVGLRFLLGPTDAFVRAPPWPVPALLPRLFLRLLLRNELLAHGLGQQVRRQQALVEQEVVERLAVEAVAERSEADAELAARLAQLTPQQFRVLLCLADGLLNKQIAATLGLAENTVKVHVTAILKKLACYSRTQAAVLVKSLEAEGMEPD